MPGLIIVLFELGGQVNVIFLEITGRQFFPFRGVLPLKAFLLRRRADFLQLFPGYLGGAFNVTHLVLRRFPVITNSST